MFTGLDNPMGSRNGRRPSCYTPLGRRLPLECALTTMGKKLGIILFRAEKKHGSVLAVMLGVGRWERRAMYDL